MFIDLCLLARTRQPIDPALVVKCGSKTLRLPVKSRMLRVEQESVPAPSLNHVFVDAAGAHVIMPHPPYSRVIAFGLQSP